MRTLRPTCTSVQVTGYLVPWFALIPTGKNVPGAAAVARIPAVPLLRIGPTWYHRYVFIPGIIPGTSTKSESVSPLIQ